MSARLDPIRALERCAWFRGMPVEVLHSLSMFAEQRSYRAGEVMLAQGKVPDCVLVLASGEAAPEGAEPIGPGALVWHLDLVNQTAVTETWTARVATTALAFTASSVNQLLAEQGKTGSSLRRAMILSLSDQLLTANQKVAEHVKANPSAARPPKALLKDLDSVLAGSRGADSTNRR